MNKHDFMNLPYELKGPAQNKWGGHRCRHMRAFKGSKFGAVKSGRILDRDEKKTVEDRLKRDGVI